VTARFVWVLAGGAAGFSVLAIVAEGNGAIAGPAAAAAVVVAALAIGGAAYRTVRWPALRARAGSLRPSGVRDWLVAGEMGREDLVLLLDRLERKTLNPTLPARTPREIGAIVRLRPEEFRGYLDRRLAQLEGSV
jgi:hypothetical protein